MATDNDIKKDKEEAYNAAQSHWSVYWEEAKKDLQFKEGKQYSNKDEQWLKSQDREALVWNRTARISNLLAGIEQKNLLALKIEPFEGADEKTASQLSCIVMSSMMRGGYMAMSGAFEMGSVITGINLVEPWIDYSSDLLNGDIKFRRLPYNRFVLDPTFTDRKLEEDCSFVYTRDYFTRDQVIGLLPDREKDIKMLKGNSSDSKFSYYYPMKGKNNEYNLKYDRFYVQSQRPYKILADMQTGRMIPIPKDPKADELLRMFVIRYPQLKIIKGMKKGVDLHIFIEGELMYSGMDPSGLDEYPFIVEAGYYNPEEDDPKYRLQGPVRCMRDPATASNRHKSMILDMLDGIIRSGWKVKSGALVNNEEVYQSGNTVLWIDAEHQMEDAQQLNSPQIPQGLFQAVDLMDKDHDGVTGVNAEMLGDPMNGDIEMSALLAKLRSNNGLTTVQSLYNNHRYAKSLLGYKLVKLVQANYTPAKVQRITGEQPTKEFYTRDFARYDCVPVEGVLTDTQRQQHYAQILAWKKMGAPIPWAHVIDYAPMEQKDKLRAAVQAEEQKAAQTSQQQSQMDMVAKALLQAQTQQTIASAQEKLTQSQENRTTAQLDRAKTIKELNQIDLESFAKTLTLLQNMLSMMKGEQAPQQVLPQQGNPLQNMNPMGRA